MKRPLRMIGCALLAWAASTAPAAAYIDPGTGSMLLQMIGAGIAGAIFYFRELRMKLLSMFTRGRTSAADDESGPQAGDEPR